MSNGGTTFSHLHQKYCQNLLLDCDHPIFDGPLFCTNNGGPTKKMLDLEKVNSEDAVTWSVFRLLETKFSNHNWLAGLLPRSGCNLGNFDEPVQINFWEKGYPSTSRLLWLLEHLDAPRIIKSRGARREPDRLAELTANRDTYRKRISEGQVRGRTPWVLEGPTEFDAVIRTPGEIIVVEAKLYSDISANTTWDTGRNQIDRVIDTGSELAKDRQLYFLLITDHYEHHPPKEYEDLLPRYRTSSDFRNLRGRIGWLTWGDIYEWLAQQNQSSTNEQREWVRRLRYYLADRNLINAN